MFNHARTLLLNLPGSSGYLADCPGEELIPPEYNQLELPTYLDVFRLRLFGARPDRAMLNYRTAQLLQLIAATELQSHVLALDPRLTYDTPRGLVDANGFRPQITRFRGTGQLSLLGNPIAPDSGGQSEYSYQVTVAGGEVTVQRLLFPATETTTPIVLTRGLSQEFELPFSGYRFRLDTDTAASWSIRGYFRPQASLGSIAEGLRSIGEPNLLQLFGVEDAEPYLTFRNCWTRHPEFAYRLGGLTLALIYRTEEVRNG
jgi:hypothetical protein